jgi:mediator of RNA polymerase II transcription subunit 17, fungi type
MASPVNPTSIPPSWKKLNLSLERPYKDDRGDVIPVLFDITPEGQHIYESWVSSAKVAPLV